MQETISRIYFDNPRGREIKAIAIIPWKLYEELMTKREPSEKLSCLRKGIEEKTENKRIPGYEPSELFREDIADYLL